jgi:hypothetical protein
VPSALPLRATSPIQRPFAIQDLSGYYPITGRRPMQSFPLSTAAVTAISSIANPRRQPAVNHDPPAVAGRALSTRRKGSPSSPAKLLKLPKLLSSPSVIVNRCLPTHLPPTPRSSVRLVVYFASPLFRFFNDSASPTCSSAFGVSSPLFRSVFVSILGIYSATCLDLNETSFFGCLRRRAIGLIKRREFPICFFFTWILNEQARGLLGCRPVTAYH